jgi:methylated-DNA-[protein]-cysteine S-methyltransferase
VLAQLGEHLPCTQGVIGSIPIRSTNLKSKSSSDGFFSIYRGRIMYIQYYDSPLGKILLAADEIGLIGVWFENQKYYASGLKEPIEKETAVLKETKEWLNLYFSGKEPKVLPKMHLIGTEFQKKVWKLLLKIPYGKTMTYKDIARMISPNMSAQAVGSAVGHNKISILIPCHRVIGSNNSLSGYAGGIERKENLLKFEKKIEI